MKRILFLVVLILAALNVQAQRNESLRGVKSLDVTIEELDTEITNDGLTKDQIKTDVELELRSHGISISKDSPNYLYVRVSSIKQTAIPAHAYSITIQFNQFVTFPNGQIGPAATWDKGNIGTIGSKEVRKVREYVKDYVDKFINDFLAVNPK